MRIGWWGRNAHLERLRDRPDDAAATGDEHGANAWIDE
jgi:hypothetical protein